MNLPNLTQSRHGTFYLRLQRNGVDCRVSLRTKNFPEARQLALLYNLYLMKNPKISQIDLEALKAEARKLDIRLPNGVEINNIHTPEEIELVRQLVQNFDPIVNVGRLDRFNAEPKPIAAKPMTKKYMEVAELYLAEVSLKNVEKTIYDKRREYEKFVEIFGDLPIGEISAESAVSFKNRLISDGCSIRLINKKISYNKEMFEYAIRNRYLVDSNPFLNLSVGDKRTIEEETEHYEPFTLDELKAIFNGDFYRKFLKKSDYRYAPLISLYSGIRLEEICSLKLEQVRTEEGITFLDVKKAKNKHSIRRIPLHEHVLKSSFMEFVEQQRKKKCVQLFDHLKPGKNGYGKNLSRRFGQYLDKLEIKSPNKVFHSLRHNAINNLTQRNVNPGLVMGLVGHYYQSQVDLSGVHFSTYQHDKILAAMKQTVDQIDYGMEFKID
ncbi:site-specific integrase [Burkholderia pseudomallei]|uniref:site-specific integrase n=1 Tax=Burkholderia pseudomallei TaxID=28450 RepID=UPI000538991F|nr:site-specific integrase [Burkholderia pseudomallei]KGU80399.1 phage integrase family protein [Burkholderia pseudomallei MSHR543]